MSLPDATVGQTYTSPGLNRSDLVVYVNDKRVEHTRTEVNGKFVYEIEGSEIDEVGTLYFKTPDGDIVDSATIVAAASAGS